MSITREEILHLSKMSSLSFSDAEIEGLEKDLGNILDYVSRLDELDTEGVELTYQVFKMQNVWREDVLEKAEADRDDLLALAPAVKDHQLKVPKIL
ncbi:Asp-tRNA(Asn)/Glu-tRNA(Gln) amidotransferase subunit GatC [Candidatus Saccharibacteria bacterium]|nr:Asp-tRNA(Asn)/Glu-tRNA(Gln) amidotransferase subunit GatC [Candidatus Saccharibacteria bacterium]